MRRSTARRVVEHCAAAFLQTILMIVIWPEFIGAVSAFVATVSLVTGLVVLFERFYEDPADPRNR